MGCSSSQSVPEGDKKPKEGVDEVKESHNAEDKQTPDDTSKKSKDDVGKQTQQDKNTSGLRYAKRYLMS